MKRSTAVYRARMALGARIRALRLQRGWTLERLAAESDVDVGTISALENRDSSRSKFAPALARALGVPLEELLSADELVRVEGSPPRSGQRPLQASEPTASYAANPAVSHIARTLRDLASLLIGIPEDMRPEIRQRMAELVDNADSQLGLSRIEALIQDAQRRASHFQQTPKTPHPAPQSTALPSSAISPRRGKQRPAR